MTKLPRLALDLENGFVCIRLCLGQSDDAGLARLDWMQSESESESMIFVYVCVCVCFVSACLDAF